MQLIHRFVGNMSENCLYNIPGSYGVEYKKKNQLPLRSEFSFPGYILSKAIKFGMAYHIWK